MTTERTIEETPETVEHLTDQQIVSRLGNRDRAAYGSLAGKWFAMQSQAAAGHDILSEIAFGDGYGANRVVDGFWRRLEEYIAGEVRKSFTLSDIVVDD